MSRGFRNFTFPPTKFDLNEFPQFVLDELVILLSIRDAAGQNYVGRLASEMRAHRSLTIGAWKSA